MPGGWWCLRSPLRCLEEPEWLTGRRCESEDLDSSEGASPDIETPRGRRAVCNGANMGGGMGGKL